MSRHLSIIAFLPVLLLVIGTGKGCATRREASARPYLVPGNSRNGLGVFSSKGCGACHSLPGETRNVGPMVGGWQAKSFTEADIVASLWNHAPRMWARMDELSFGHPSFTSMEMADLFAFLYYLSVLDPPGNPTQGRFLFLQKGCDQCHEVTLEESGKAGPAVPYWRAHTTAIRLAQAMWNHATKMRSQTVQSGVPWAKLEKSDLADIVAYVRIVNKIAVNKEFLVGDQVRGRDLFAARGCADCHGLHNADATLGPSVEEMNGAARRIGELGALMWNHFPSMSALLGESPSRRLQLSVDEMADLFAYLFSVGYFAEVGDPAKGREVFLSKKCVTCHEERGSGGAPWYKLPTRFSFITMATALWNHGPRMIEALRKAGLDWPELTRDQIVDLTAYLGTRD